MAMSLDVYLNQPEQDVSCMCADCGHEHTRKSSPCVYSDNITHNLARMAEAAGVYDIVWRPEEHGITTAAQLVDGLRNGIDKLKAQPEAFRQYDATNGWGTYEHFVPFLEKYLEACEQYQDALVGVSR